MSPERRGGLARVPRRPGLVRYCRAPYDDLHQGMKEEMMQMLVWAHINREKRMSARSAYRAHT
eukprot:5213432-Prymnesium_polylepis.1